MKERGYERGEKRKNHQCRAPDETALLVDF